MRKGDTNILYLAMVIAEILGVIVILYLVYKEELELSSSKMGIEITASEIKGTFILLDELGNEIKQAKFCIPLKKCSKVILSSDYLIVYGLKKGEEKKELPMLITQFGGGKAYYEGEKGLVSLKGSSLEVPCFIKGKPNYLCFNKVGNKIIIS